MTIVAPSWAWTTWSTAGYLDRELAASQWAGAAGGNGPVVRRHEAADDRQAQAQPSGGSIDRLRLLDEWLEHGIEHVGHEADPLVLDADPDDIPFASPGDHDAGARLAVF